MVLFIHGENFSVTKPALAQLICKRFRMDTLGQDLIEYALAAGLVAVAAVASMPALTATVSAIFVKIGSLVNAGIS
jgi:pilus assembly protein Flp/PilA